MSPRWKFSDDANAKLGAILLFWLLTATLVALIARGVATGFFHATSRWKPLDVDPVSYLSGLILLLAIASASAWFLSRGRSQPWLLAGAGAAGVASVALMIASAVPASGSIAIRDHLVPERDPPAGSSFGIPVLFANGGHELSTSEAAMLKRNLAIFRECTTTRISVRGFASSARFEQEDSAASDSKNLQLANLRANAVVAALKQVGISAAPKHWLTFEDMNLAKRVVDRSGSGGRLLAEESRNRRAEILWHGSPCSAS